MMGEGDRRCRDRCIGHTLAGNIKTVLENRKAISMEEILEPQKGSKLSLVFIEGAPGIGKSTLAWELCRKWEEFPCMKKYQLVILLRLREEEVQHIRGVGDLFYSYECENKRSLVDQVIQSQGEGILFVLDGFDELPEALQMQGYLLKLINGLILPESTVLLTSRPSATAKLLLSCRSRIQRHVEILGFTQESVEKYASCIFSSDPERLEKFKTYISMSENPAINSLMYVPLNAAIIAEIYRSNSSDDVLPHTLTDLYTQISLTLLNRYLATTTSYPPLVLDRLENLPVDLHRQFLQLCQLAYEGIRHRNITFQNLTPNMTHFGFLDAVPALYGGGSVSYNFLHLTLQEFFAAYYACHSSKDRHHVIELNLEQWNLVWRFIAGLTSFKLYKEEFTRHFKNEFLKKRSWRFFVQCVFGAKTTDGLKLDSAMFLGIAQHLMPMHLGTASLTCFWQTRCMLHFKIWGYYLLMPLLAFHGA